MIQHIQQAARVCRAQGQQDRTEWGQASVPAPVREGLSHIFTQPEPRIGTDPRPPLLRIQPDVVDNAVELLFVANDSIVSLPLPNLIFSSKLPLKSKRRERFPRMLYRGKPPAPSGHHNHVHMVVHDYRGAELEVAAICMPNDLKNNRAFSWPQIRLAPMQSPSDKIGSALTPPMRKIPAIAPAVGFGHCRPSLCGSRRTR